MLRGIFAATCLAFALALVAGCGSQNAGGGQPKLANPEDPKVKDQRPVGVGGAPKGAGGQANPF